MSESVGTIQRLWQSEFLRFAVIGTVAFVIDTIVLYVMLWVGLGHYRGACLVSGRGDVHVVRQPAHHVRVDARTRRAGDRRGVAALPDGESHRRTRQLCDVCLARQRVPARARESGARRGGRLHRRAQRELHAEQDCWCFAANAHQT